MSESATAYSIHKSSMKDSLCKAEGQGAVECKQIVPASWLGRTYYLLQVRLCTACRYCSSCGTSSTVKSKVFSRATCQGKPAVHSEHNNSIENMSGHQWIRHRTHGTDRQTAVEYIVLIFFSKNCKLHWL